jgi:hypothetical protein
LFDEYLDLPEAVEDFTLQKFIPDLAVEGLAVTCPSSDNLGQIAA